MGFIETDLATLDAIERLADAKLPDEAHERILGPYRTADAALHEHKAKQPGPDALPSEKGPWIQDHNVLVGRRTDAMMSLGRRLRANAIPLIEHLKPKHAELADTIRAVDIEHPQLETVAAERAVDLPPKLLELWKARRDASVALGEIERIIYRQLWPAHQGFVGVTDIYGAQRRTGIGAAEKYWTDLPYESLRVIDRAETVLTNFRPPSWAELHNAGARRILRTWPEVCDQAIANHNIRADNCPAQTMHGLPTIQRIDVPGHLEEPPAPKPLRDNDYWDREVATRATKASA